MGGVSGDSRVRSDNGCQPGLSDLERPYSCPGAAVRLWTHWLETAKMMPQTGEPECWRIQLVGKCACFSLHCLSPLPQEPLSRHGDLRRRSVLFHSSQNSWAQAIVLSPKAKVTPRIRMVLTRWEAIDQAYSNTTIVRNRRHMEILRVNDDGSISYRSSSGDAVGRFDREGVLTVIGRSPERGGFRSETIPLSDGNFRTVFTYASGRILRVRAERIPEAEALALAAILYPAEYGQRSGRPAAVLNFGDRSASTALVVGIGSYRVLPRLANPINDAVAISERLQSLGYRVELLLDPSVDEFNDAIVRHGSDIERQPRGRALFYYAGHAIEIGGRNYLLPTDTDLNRAVDLEVETVPVENVLAQSSPHRSMSKIVILDACRTPPRQRPDAGRGLAMVSAPERTFIAYSTAPGMAAADGAGRNSPFALALLEQLGNPHQPIEALFRNVRRDVIRLTDGEQIPWDSSSLLEPLTLA